jgi:hypothetical protein
VLFKSLFTIHFCLLSNEFSSIKYTIQISHTPSH